MAVPTSNVTRSKRVLACYSCASKKIRCNRTFPCSNCIRSGSECLQSSSLRQRKRRFPERELLDCLARYESLLKQNDIPFEPLHPHQSVKKGQYPNTTGDQDDHCSPDGGIGDTNRSSPPSLTAKSDVVYETKNIWLAMTQSRVEPDDEVSDSSSDVVHETIFKRAWHQFSHFNDNLLFGSHDLEADLIAMHPEQVQIFRLWQTFITNVNPLLRVVHVPSLQSRIIDAAGNIANADPNLIALMFSIYCMAILSISEEECSLAFGEKQQSLLTRYRFACRQALLDCKFLRTSDRDCLTALYLYLLCIRSDIDPQSLSSMLGVAMRIAKRMGLSSESSYARQSPLEAEMRRRLWWSLVLYDSRICELADQRGSFLDPTWDCNIPLNLDDSELQVEMKETPPSREGPTEALFAVVRSEIGHLTRNCSFYLDFLNPALKVIVADTRRNDGNIGNSSKAGLLAKSIEDKYLQYVNFENPLHFMTVWTARGQLAKNRLLEHFSRFPNPSIRPTEKQRDVAITHALTMLECDTHLVSSPLTKPYTWFLFSYFPFLGYMHIVQDMKRRPLHARAAQCWDVMSANYAKRFRGAAADHPFYPILASIYMQAWVARESALREESASHGLGATQVEVPFMIEDIRTRLGPGAQTSISKHEKGPSQIHEQDTFTCAGVDPLSDNAASAALLGPDFDFLMAMPMQGVGIGPLQGFAGSDFAGMMKPGPPCTNTIVNSAFMSSADGASGQESLGVDMGELNLTPMDWNPIHGYGW